MSLLMWVLFGINGVAALVLGLGLGNVIAARRRDNRLYDDYIRDMKAIRVSPEDGNSPLREQ